MIVLLLPGHQDFDGTIGIRPKPGEQEVAGPQVPVKKQRPEIEDKPILRLIYK